MKKNSRDQTMSKYAADEILRRFDKNLKTIQEKDTHNVAVIKELTANLTNMQQKFIQFTNGFVHFYHHLQSLPFIYSSVEEITVAIGNLEAGFEDAEEMIGSLESICFEEDRIKMLLEEREEVHALKLRRKKELEDIKAKLATEHSDLLEQVEKDRARKKIASENELQQALWKLDVDSEKQSEMF